MFGFSIREIISNIVGSLVADAVTPGGMIGYVLGLAIVAWMVFRWHQHQRAAKKRGMASWQFIALCFLLALIAIGGGAFGLGLRFANQSNEPTQSATQQSPTPRPLPHYSQKEKNDLLDAYRDLTTMLNKYGAPALNLGNTFINEWEDGGPNPFNKETVIGRLKAINTLIDQLDIEMFQKYIRGNAYENELLDVVVSNTPKTQLNDLRNALAGFINSATYVSVISKDGDNWEKIPGVHVVLEPSERQLKAALQPFGGWLTFCRGRINDRMAMYRQ